MPRSFLSFAHRLAEVASAEIQPRFQQVATEHKADGSEVTEADRAAEMAMRALIEAEYPDHGIIGEEAEAVTGARYTWVLDPIDGTAWFSLGIPKFGTLVALLDNGESILGVVHLPITAETLHAERGEGCWYTRGEQPPQRVQVDTSVRRVADAYISAAGVKHTEIRPDRRGVQLRLGPISRVAGRLRFVGDCVQHMLVARGVLHAALDPVMSPWDIAALVPCLLEAGGTVSTIDGRTTDLVFGGSLLSACHPALHEEILGLVNP
ncbi:MAG: inositol monophosphatase family protein [Bacteroidota bacterium]